ncbi:SMODS domain-containing nucleotidyltransferase [Clostridium tyrobutyricum]|uniref:SMODS domain-containing nucleotidyltransferase n=1 Tax=Clostridium tyrobutyricum TaxID=1519 RepID=UPI0039F64BEB
MKLNDYFKVFNSNISLNPTRDDKIESAFETWKANFKENEKLKEIFNEFYAQGSYATGTAIRPQNSNEFDVDSILVLDLEDSKKPKETLTFIANVLKSYEAYKDKITVKDRCVRINYAGDFHMDIVPAKPTDEEYVLIACKSEDEWKETNPVGFKNWFIEKNAEASYKLSPVTRAIKHWRDYSVGKDTAPKSILLTTLIAKHINGCNSIAKSIVLTLESLVDDIDDILDKDGEPFVENPSLEKENLARDWSKSKFDIFKKKLSKFASDSRAALDEKDSDKSIKMWRNIFGNKFPDELPEEADSSENIKNGNILVNSSGMLNNVEGTKILEHRFFGGYIDE